MSQGRAVAQPHELCSSRAAPPLSRYSAAVQGARALQLSARLSCFRDISPSGAALPRAIAASPLARHSATGSLFSTPPLTSLVSLSDLSTLRPHSTHPPHQALTHPIKVDASHARSNVVPQSGLCAPSQAHPGRNAPGTPKDPVRGWALSAPRFARRAAPIDAQLLVGVPRTCSARARDHPAIP
jgi:hypothetical protein